MFRSKRKQLEDPENQVHEYQKWIHINLTDFRSTSCLSILSYFWLWFLGVIAVLVYAADTYTAVILLAFNRWPGQIAPRIPFSVSRWIFAICIIFSWLLLGYQWIRAIRVLRRGSVAKDYLDPLAAQFQSMRSWRRFLVFAALTESKKGVDYVALFSYFQFQGAVRIIIAQGPRQAINAITLYAVMKAVLLPDGNKPGSSTDQFFTNVKVLAQTQHEHAVILFTMLFTLIIWAFSALSLIFSCLAYLCFLWHYVGSNLTRYCKRKIEKRLKKIVAAAIEKEMGRQQRLRERAGMRRPGLFSRNNSNTSLISKPTLPAIVNEKESDAISISTTVTRQSSAASSTSTLTSFTSPAPALPPPPQIARVGTGQTQPRFARQPTLPCIDESPSFQEHSSPPSRKNSNNSFSSSGSGGDAHDDRPLLTRNTTESNTTASSDTIPPSLMSAGQPLSYDPYPRPLNVTRKPVPRSGQVQSQVAPIRGMNQARGGAAAQGRWAPAARQGVQSSNAPKTFDAMGV